MLEKLKEQKWIYVVLSILLAILFWYYVRIVEDPEYTKTIRNVPVEIVGIDELEQRGLTVTSQSQEYVDITVRGNSSVLDQLSRSTIEISANASSVLEAGEDFPLAYTIKYPSTVAPGSVRIEQYSPERITVDVNKLYSQTFEIEFMFTGSVAEGYQKGFVTVNPLSVTVSGQMDQVTAISRVVAILHRENLTEAVSEDLPVVLLDADGNQLNLDVKLNTQTTHVTMPVVVSKEIPLVMTYTYGGGISETNVQQYVTSIIHPSTITVSGPKEDIETLSEHFLGNIDLSKINGTTSMTLPIQLDSRITNESGINEATVVVTIAGLATRSFDVTNIELQQIPDGYYASTVTQMRTVVVRGTEEALAQLDAGQIRIVADLSGVSAVGSASIPVTVYLDAGAEVGIIGEYSIVVNVNHY